MRLCAPDIRRPRRRISSPRSACGDCMQCWPHESCRRRDPGGEGLRRAYLLSVTDQRAGSNNSMGLLSGSSIWIWRPPGPVSISLRDSAGLAETLTVRTAVVPDDAEEVCPERGPDVPGADESPRHYTRENADAEYHLRLHHRLRTDETAGCVTHVSASSCHNETT
jgi:hypothetical protein